MYVERANGRPGDVLELLPAGRAVDARRFVELLRMASRPAMRMSVQNAAPSKMSPHRHRHRQLRVGEPVRPVESGESEDELVHHAPLGVEHEADRENGRDRRRAQE